MVDELNAEPRFEDRLDPGRYQQAARLLLADPTYGWIEGVGGDGRALEANLAAYSRHRLVMRVLRDVSGTDLATEVFGVPLGLPVLVAPVGLQMMVHPDGESATARGAAAASSLAVFSVNATVSFEEIGEAAGERGWWLQTYNWADLAALEQVVTRAVGAGCRAIVPNVNTPVDAAHTRLGLGFALGPGVGFPNHLPGRTSSTATHDETYIGWLTQITDLPIIPKGIVHPEDAQRAVAAGASGVIVSNHGGRHADRGVATLDALVEVRAAIGTDTRVYLDGGIRHGADVAIALALGADAVMIGRPAMWGLAVGGARGVHNVLEHLGRQLREELQLCGITDLTEISPDLVRGAPGTR